MNTISIDAVGRDKLSASAFNIPVAVVSNRLATFEHAAFSGVFQQTAAGTLPSYSAKSFRITNSSGANIEVGQKQMFFSKTFDEDTDGMSVDSPSLSLSTESNSTPLGLSEVMKLVHTAGTAAYHTVDSVGLDGVIFKCYFKVDSLDDEISPLALYSDFDSIDINFPGAAIRIKPDLSIHARAGYNNTSIGSSPIALGVWHRATLSLGSDSFTASVERWTGASYVSLTTNTQITSSGNGLLTDIAGNPAYVIGVTSEGNAVQYVDAIQGYISTGEKEILLNGDTKEYFCQTSLDEFDVTGACSGYFRR